MKTFFSWVIANFEGILFCIIFSIAAIFLFNNTPINDDGTIVSHKGLLKLLTLSAVFIGGLTLQTKNVGVGIIKYLLVLAILIWKPGLDDSQLLNHWTFLWTLFIGSSVIGSMFAFYAFSNFDDVVSCRMLYYNSDVSLFEEEWKYTIERFTGISLSIFLNIGWLIFIFKL